MKIEQILVHYLLKNKELALQGIGTFHVNSAIPEPSDGEKGILIPENAISFSYDPKVKEDEGLINYIVEHTSKIKSLASSDLDSFLSLGRQFLNIGKPFNIPNLGTLEKTNSGELVFKSGQMIAQKIEPQKIKMEEAEMTPEEEGMFNDYQKERRSNKGSKAFFIILALLALGAIGWAVWQYGFNQKDEGVTNLDSTEAVTPLTDTVNHSINDSAKAITPTDSSALTAIKSPQDSFTFKVVVNEFFTPDAANARLRKLKSFRRNVIMYTTDSVTYKIAEPFMLPLADTTRVMDSLKRYYSKVYLEK